MSPMTEKSGFNHKFFENIMRNIHRKIVKKLENRDTSLGLLFAMFISVVFLRTFLEVVLGVGKMTTVIALALHYPMFYLSLLITLASILRIFSGERMEKIIRVLIPAYSIIVLPPIVDLIFWGIGGFRPKYLFFSGGDLKNIFSMFITFFGHSSLRTGITLGMRIEIALGLLGIGWYVRQKSGRWWRSILAVIIAYVLIFCYVSQPIFHRFARRLALYLGFVRQGELGWTQFWMLVITFQFPILMYLWNKKKFTGIFGNLRPFRTVHFEAMFLLGFYLGVRGKIGLLAETNLYHLVFSLLSFFFAWEFSVVVNDIIDIEIDKVTNRNRPLAVGVLTKMEMSHLAIFYLLFSVLSAGLINGRLLFVVLSFVAVYWLYSVPPARLKRIPVLSAAITSFASIMPIFGGVIIAGRHPIAAPENILWAIFIAFAISFNAKDLKDCLGDEKAGIKTLMTIFGCQRGRQLIGILVMVSYTIFPMIVGIWDYRVILVSIVFGALSMLMILKDIGEWAIFLTYFLYFSVFMLFFKRIFEVALFS